MKQNSSWHKLWFIFVLGAILAGCGVVPASRIPSTPDLLVQSGFQAQPVKSPDHLRKMPAYQFFTLDRQGRTIYVYFDPRTKQVFFGSEPAYYRYKANAARAGAEEAIQATLSSQPTMTTFDWDMYGELHGVGP